MAYQLVGWNAQFAGLCLAYVQSALGLPHCGASAIDAWNGCYAGQHTSNPQPNDLCFFGAAASNDGYGHVGILQCDTSLMQSVLSNGEEAIAPVAQFASDNGAPLLGYVSTGKSASAGCAAPASSVSSHSFSLPSLTPGLAAVAATFLFLVLAD